MKTTFFRSIGFIVLLSFIGCEKDELELGPYEHDFQVSTVYQASTDGFVVVNVSSNGSAFKATLLSDETTVPTTELASVIWDGGSMTVPIKRNNYWKVIHNNVNVDELTITISWIPLQ